MGRGIVEPVDDFRESNPPSNPELLEALTDAFVAGGYRAEAAGRADHEVADLSARRRARTRPTPTTRSTSPAPRSACSPRRSCSTRSARCSTARAGSDRAPRRSRRRNCPAQTGRAVPEDLWQARPTADLRMRAIRVDDPGPGVSAHQRRPSVRACWKPTTTGSAVCSARSQRRRDPRRADLATLGREPTASERARASWHMSATAKDRRKAWEDVAWALVNSKEFLLRH